MLEYMRVETPAIFPQACVCGSAKGPLVDFMIEKAGGRMYLCALCVKRSARVLGLVKGERMEELLNHSALLDEARHAIEDRDKMIEQQMSDLAAAARRNESLQELLDQERDARRTERHLVDMISESAKQLQAGAA